MSKIQLELDVPEGFNELSAEDKARICNGAGAADGIKVPNTNYGLNLKKAYDIHDYDYEVGEDDEAKRLADKRMLWNSITMIVNYGGFLMVPRLYRAMTYFVAVAVFGKKAFYAGKGNGVIS